MERKDSWLDRILTSPLLWGGLASLSFYTILHTGWINHPLMLRYFTGHEVEYITTIMFFVALAALGRKLLQVRSQRASLRYTPILGPRERDKVDIRQVSRFLEKIDAFERKYDRSILSDRLRESLHFIQRCGSATELDTELRYLAEEDVAKAEADYGLVRLVLWSVPMLGFLGTVIGITMALGNLDLNAINESSKMLSAGLSVAFDTTALAIALDVVLYFVQFLVYREESNFLWEVDKLADNELRGRFEQEIGQEDSGQVVAVRRMLEAVVRALEDLFGMQSSIWEKSMSVADQRFRELSLQSTDMMKQSLTAAMSESVTLHARTLAETESQWIGRSENTMNQLEGNLRENINALKSLQEGTLRQTEAVQALLETGGLLVKLEERLHHNLAALAQVGNFEDTLHSLAAAIHLLNGKRSMGEFQPTNMPFKQQSEKGSAA